MIARVQHIRAANLCTRGARVWFRNRGWSWTDFLRDGLPVERLRETGDALAMRVADAAEKDAR